jgi:hypothetical protein
MNYITGIKKAAFATFFGLACTAPLFSAEVNKELSKALQKESQSKEVLQHFQRDYILLKKGEWEFENNFQITYNSSNQIFLDSFAILDPTFLTLGQFGVESFKRHIFRDILTWRTGITDYFQGEISIPLMYRHDQRAKAAINEESTLDEGGIGDIAAAFSYQIVRETNRKPAVVTTLSFKSKTGKSPFEIDPETDLPLGSGYYSIKAGANFVKTIDPVAVFGGVSYAFNLNEDVDQTIEIKDENGTVTGTRGLSKVEPGDTVSLNVGLGYAVSYDFSLNFQFLYDHTLATYSTVDGTRNKVANSTINSAQFKIGAGWALDKKSSINFSLGIGLTSDSPDFVFEVRTPFRY